METAEMRRSTLQRKDRDELIHIAETLGATPPSRIRKGEIIEVILDLVSGDGDYGSPTSHAASSPSSGSSPSASSSSASSSSGSSLSASSSSGSSSSGSVARARLSSGATSTDARGGSSAGAAGAGEPTSPELGVPDPANRRRRRRGRDRDRRDDGSVDWEGESISVEGHIDLRHEGYGFLRVDGYLAGRDDAYVPVKLVRRYGLRKGDAIAGMSRPAARSEKNPAMLSIDSVNGDDPEAAPGRPHFDDLTPVFPNQRLVMETNAGDSAMAARIIDLLSPIGKGQRGLIASPPRAGKTTILSEIVRSLETNNPEVRLMALLIDARPEEVTEMRRSSVRAEVIASEFDRPPEEHVTLAEMTVERAKRMAEMGDDVCVILDGLTRLARAYSAEGPGRTKGFEAAAIHSVRRLFGAARNLEEAGSVTIIATALLDSGSEADETIFEELAGVAGMELRLDPLAAARRIFPAIDVVGSSTRREDLLIADQGPMRRLRRRVEAAQGPGPSTAGLEMLLDRLGSFDTNKEFLAEV